MVSSLTMSLTMKETSYFLLHDTSNREVGRHSRLKRCIWMVEKLMRLQPSPVEEVLLLYQSSGDNSFA